MDATFPTSRTVEIVSAQLDPLPQQLNRVLFQQLVEQRNQGITPRVQQALPPQPETLEDFHVPDQPDTFPTQKTVEHSIPV